MGFWGEILITVSANLITISANEATEF